ncbi:MAG: response regulator, partial [Verrucomicrobiota bacterium]
LRRSGYEPTVELLSWRDGQASNFKKEAWDVILCNDLQLEEESFQALMRFKETGLEIPFIILSETIDENRAAKFIEAGAEDFVAKSNLRRLGFILQRELRRAERFGLKTQWLQSQKMESVGQLAGGFAHEFNNILTVIQGHSSMLAMSEIIDAGTRDSAQQISLAAERATNLTRQLLTFSRRQILQPQSLDLNEAVKSISKMLARVLTQDICLQVTYSPTAPIISADEKMIEQLLLNLAVNSRDAMLKGGHLIINVSMQLIGRDYVHRNPEACVGEVVLLTVSDTGRGICAEELPRIFEPFFTRKAVGEGTGMGLATVYGIVKQHRGWITVDSEVGTGTTFQIYFPVSKGKAVKIDSPVQSNTMRGGSETILVVDDESPVRNLVTHILKQLGYSILEADSGVTALKVYKESRGRIHLLLTDMVMPDGMTGRELAEIVQFNEPELKVIFTSGYNAEIVGKDFTLNEGLNFLQKPYQPKKLAKVIRDCLDDVRATG